MEIVLQCFPERDCVLDWERPKRGSFGFAQDDSFVGEWREGRRGSFDFAQDDRFFGYSRFHSGMAISYRFSAIDVRVRRLGAFEAPRWISMMLDSGA